MIIFGTRTTESTTQTGTCSCPYCRTPQTFRFVNINRWFTLYFIPVLPLGRVGQQAECQGCFSRLSMEALSEASPVIPSVDSGHPQSVAADPYSNPYTLASSSPGAVAGAATPISAGMAPPPANVVPRTTSGYAIASLVLGIFSVVTLPTCGIGIFPALGAIATGHLALSKIRSARGELDGRGMAIGGLVMGYSIAAISVMLLVLIGSLMFLEDSSSNARQAARPPASNRRAAPPVEINRPADFPIPADRGIPDFPKPDFGRPEIPRPPFPRAGIEIEVPEIAEADRHAQQMIEESRQRMREMQQRMQADMERARKQMERLHQEPALPPEDLGFGVDFGGGPAKGSKPADEDPNDPLARARNALNDLGSEPRFGPRIPRPPVVRPPEIPSPRFPPFRPNRDLPRQPGAPAQPARGSNDASRNPSVRPRAIPGLPSLTEVPAAPAEVVQRFRDLRSRVRSLAFSADDRWLAVGCVDRTVRILDIQSGRTLASAERIEELGEVRAIAFTQDQKRLVAVGHAGGVVTWPLEQTGTLGEMQRLTPHRAPAESLAVSPSGLFAMSGAAGELVWQTLDEGSPQTRQLKVLNRKIIALHLPQRGTTALATDGQRLVTVNLKSGTAIENKSISRQVSRAAAFSPDGRRLALIAASGIQVFDTESGSEVQKVAKRQPLLWSLTFFADGDRVACGGSNGIDVFRLSAPETSQRRYDFGVRNVQLIGVSPSGEMMAGVTNSFGQPLQIVRVSN